jgi:RNA polymerase sigma-70 factor (ECF subfamily)
MNTDETLTEIKKRNAFVFKRLFQDLYPELVSYARQYLFDFSSSEDVVQEVFAQLWEKSDSINVQTSIRAYMYSMVRNRCLNILKSIKITDNSKILETQATFDIEYNPDWHLDDEAQVLYEKVMVALEKLPQKMRAIVRLRFIENYHYNEIAEELDISVNTVKTQLKRAKIKFSELIVSLIILTSII